MQSPVDAVSDQAARVLPPLPLYVVGEATARGELRRVARSRVRCIRAGDTLGEAQTQTFGVPVGIGGGSWAGATRTIGHRKATRRINSTHSGRWRAHVARFANELAHQHQRQSHGAGGSRSLRLPSRPRRARSARRW
jgi:hypothetical protein